MNGIRHMFESTRFHLANLVYTAGLFGGQSDYCKFIILGRGRTGSNFLRGLLNSHSQIITFGELFRFYDSIGWEAPHYELFQHSSRLLSLMQNDPVRFLENAVFKKFPKHVAAVGFKLFYYHARDDSRRMLWAYLKDRKDIRILHVKRWNTLRMILSEKKAFATNSWTNITGEEERKFSVVLDYEECLHRFKHEKEVSDEHDSLFQAHPTHDVIYERLLTDCQKEIRPIQEFLGVDFEHLKPSTYKQSNQPLSEAISNYCELKAKFRNSPWEGFFDDS